MSSVKLSEGLSRTRGKQLADRRSEFCFPAADGWRKKLAANTAAAIAYVWNIPAGG
jgi:hypothetical protein